MRFPAMICLLQCCPFGDITKKHFLLNFLPTFLGKTEVAAAINTWIFGIEHMKRAFRGRVDPDTWNHVERIGKESENFLLQLTSPYRPSDKDFPRIIYNNRWVFGVWRNEGDVSRDLLERSFFGWFFFKVVSRLDVNCDWQSFFLWGFVGLCNSLLHLHVPFLDDLFEG